MADMHTTVPYTGTGTLMTAAAVTASAIEAARPTVSRFAVQTPTIPSDGLAEVAGAPVHLKLESLQPTGSFKIRGAAHIASLDTPTRSRGVITASTGNHGRAVAHIARQLGVSATACLSDNVPPGKVEALRRLGCHLDVGGPSQDAAAERAERAAADGGPVNISIFDPQVIVGHGTCGLEIIEQVANAGTVIAPVSAGGLASGIAVAVKAHHPDCRVIGVSMDRGASMHASLQAGHPVELPEAPDTLADSLQSGIGRHNDTTFPIVRDMVDDLLLVTEAQIADAMHYALAEHRLVLEGAGAVGIAALATGAVDAPVGPVVVVCSGANAELSQIADAAARSTRSY